MQHSHEALDRPGGFAKAGLLSPLRHRDFRVLWAGMAVSLLGDGIFLIAIAWETYALWNAPAALSIVGIAMTVPTIVFLLVGGVLSDRHDRRRLMLAADAVRAVAVACLAVLVFAGALQLWELVVLVALYGAGTAFFTPAFEAIVPDLLPRRGPRRRELARPVRSPDRTSPRRPAARGLAGRRRCRAGLRRRRGVVRRLRHRGLGDAPAAYSESVTRVRLPRGAVGRASAFHPPASVALGHARCRGGGLPRLPRSERGAAPLRRQERPPRLGGNARASSLRQEVSGPSARRSGWGSRGQPRRDITFMYATWTLATLAVAGYGLATAAWQLMLACLLFNALETAGTIVWATVKQRHVPSAMLGRVSSLDWLISIGLLPSLIRPDRSGRRSRRGARNARRCSRHRRRRSRSARSSCRA